MRRASLGERYADDIEVLHFTGDLAGEGARVEQGDAAYSGLAGENVRPGFGNGVADGADDS